MLFNEARGVFNEEYFCLLNGPYGLDRKYNALWGMEYQMFFLMELDEKEIDRLVSEMVILRSLEGVNHV